MFTMIKMAKTVLQGKKGQGMVEYGLILALVAVAALFAFTTMGTTLRDMLVVVTNSL